MKYNTFCLLRHVVQVSDDVEYVHEFSFSFQNLRQ